MTFIETRLVYPAPPLGRSDWSLEGRPLVDAAFESGDGTPLHGWFYEHAGAERAVLYFHGNGEQVADNGELIELLGRRLNASVLVFDYRGYGKSGGRPSERGLIRDGCAAQQWLARRTGRRPDEVVLIGRSLGGAVAIAVARQQGAAALVLQSTFSRLTDAAAIHFPWLPVRWVMRNRYNSLERIAEYRGPVFASHGTDDQVVPLAQGRALFAATPGTPKVFYAIEGGRHDDPQPREYYTALAAFLDRAASPPTATEAAESTRNGPQTYRHQPPASGATLRQNSP